MSSQARKSPERAGPVECYRKGSASESRFAQQAFLRAIRDEARIVLQGLRDKVFLPWCVGIEDRVWTRLNQSPTVRMDLRPYTGTSEQVPPDLCRYVDYYNTLFSWSSREDDAHAKRLLRAMLDWSDSHRITTPWVLGTARDTLDLWRLETRHDPRAMESDRTAVGRNEWAVTLYQHSDCAFAPEELAFRFELAPAIGNYVEDEKDGLAWDPDWRGLRQDEFDRIVKAFKLKLTSHFGRLEGLARERELHRTPTKKRLTEHATWLVRHLILRESRYAIANSTPSNRRSDGNGTTMTQKNVSKGLDRLAALLRLALPSEE